MHFRTLQEVWWLYSNTNSTGKCDTEKKTITVEFQSQVHRITNYFVFMLEIFYHKDTKTHYLVIILLYQARGSEPQVVLRDYLIVSVSYTISSSFRENSTTYQKVSAISW